MQNKNFGVIFDIKPEKFFAEGSFYINEDLTKNDDNSGITKIQLTSKLMSSFSFDNKIQEIVDSFDKEQNNNLAKQRAYNVNNFFKENAGKTLDLIFFPDTGISGIDKVIIPETAIFYIKVSANIKLGFFINKYLANILFNSGDY